MANFRQHLSFSTAIGVGFGATSHFAFGVSPTTSILAGSLCSVSGMLPDIDSNSGKPLRESLSFGGAVIAMMMANRLKQLGLEHDTVVLIGVVVYLSVRFALAKFLRKFTVHRGMFHSLPAMLIFGELTYLISSGTQAICLLKACAVMTGFFSHLLLDEFFSVEWYRGRMRIKKSFGTAIKLFDPKHLWPNVSTYVKLGFLSYIIFYSPAWLDRWNAEQRQQFAREAIQHFIPPTDEATPADPTAQTPEEVVAEGRGDSWWR